MNEEREPERERAPYVGVTEWRFERNAEEAAERNARRAKAWSEVSYAGNCLTNMRRRDVPLVSEYYMPRVKDALEKAARLYECIQNTVDGEWIRHGSKQDVANAKAIREFIRVELCGKAPS